MESIIKWRTGIPTEEGTYLVSYRFSYYPIESPLEKVYTTGIGTSYWHEFWHNYEDEADDCKVLAWCPLSEIEPYKE